MSLKIAVLLGGTSAERDVSLVSGQEIAKALNSIGHQVLAVDCAFGARLIEDWEKDINEIIQVTHSDFEQRKIELDRNLIETMRFLLAEKVDVVFIALHGGYGENGQIQALLDLVKIPYTGSGSLASAIGMDKHLSKILFQKNGVTTAPWIQLKDQMAFPRNEIEDLGLPVVIKPNDQGSTVGLTVVREQSELDTAIALAFRFSHSVLAEKYIPGREMTVSVLGDQALPVIEIIPEHGIYDYECKYQKGKSQYIVPAEITDRVTRKLQEMALAAYHALDFRHYARVDFRLDPENSPYCLEVNSLPGMTATSLVPKAARATGIEFPELVDRIVRMPLQKEKKSVIS